MNKKKKGLGLGAIISIVIGSLIFIGVISFFVIKSFMPKVYSEQELISCNHTASDNVLNRFYNKENIGDTIEKISQEYTNWKSNVQQEVQAEYAKCLKTDVSNITHISVLNKTKTNEQYMNDSIKYAVDKEKEIVASANITSEKILDAYKKVFEESKTVDELYSNYKNYNLVAKNMNVKPNILMSYFRMHQELSPVLDPQIENYLDQREQELSK